MEEQLYLCNLYEYYGLLLTDKQQEYFKDYYYDNLTMEEISENNGVSKNAISKTILEVKEKLKYYEDNLHLFRNKEEILKKLDKKQVEKIIDYI